MANYNLSLPAETIDELLLWLDDKQDIIIKQTDLLSGTGQSTTGTMTQKAITDALGTKADSSNVYTKTETDTLLGGKADKSTTYTKTETDTLLNNKVDKEAGKGLSTNDYTDADKTKLGALPTAAELDSELAVLAGEAGLAEAVIDTDGAGTEQEFTFRKSGGDGGAYYRKIKGKTLAWNQLISISDIGASQSGSGITITNNNDGSVTISGTATADIEFRMAHIYGANTIHKYILPPISGESAETYFIRTGYGQNGVFTPANAYCPLDIVVKSGASVNVNYYFQLTDLTLMGIADEINTPADFEALYPNPIPYNPGTLISNDAAAVETTGVNQWDEEWGNYLWDEGNGGVRSANSNSFGCVEHIPVLPSTNYFLASNSGGVFYVLFYDAEKNFISYQYPAQSFTTPANCAYITFYSYQSYGTTYKNDICINLSNPAINGQYFPYWKRTINIGITTKEDTDGNVPFADGMKGAGTAADWADKVGGEKRMKRVDLGNVNWEYNATYQFFIGTTILDNPIGVAGVTPNMICPKYETYETRYDSQVAGGPDKIISGYSAANGVIIHDTDHSAADLVNGHAAWLEGVMLDYELATPVPFTWAEPLNLGVKVDENGTERAVAPEGATEPSAPFVADTTYTMSVARMVEILKNL